MTKLLGLGGRPFGPIQPTGASGSRRLVGALLLATCLGLPASAQVPGILSHQGRLQVHGTNFHGSAHFKFSLLTTNGQNDAVTLWSHNGTGTGGSEPSAPAVTLPVTRGVFSVNLGDPAVANMTAAIPATAFTNAEVWLRIWVDDGANGSQLLSPDRRLTSVGHALTAGTVLGTVGGLDSAQVAGGATLANDATSLNTSDALVRRDADGNFAAGTVTATFVGDAAGLTNFPAAQLAGTAPSATNFVGLLTGDVSGPQVATVVGAVGGVTAAAVASGAILANNATRSNILGTIVLREECYGDFDAGTIRATFVGDGSGLTNLPTTPIAYQAPAGSLLVSIFAEDTTLISAGYRLMMTLPAPGWVNGSATAVPSARSAHSTVWTGTEMLVWGGVGASGTPVNSGGAYAADTDSWTALTTVGAPAGRGGHTTVWTGTEMIVWGGQGASGNLGTGGRYSPGTLTWNPVSTIGAPEARQGHVAVWTGNRMIVWGGLNLAGLRNDGALYDPVGNTWTALPTDGAPQGRMGAAAVWAGDRLIVWGGQGESGDLATGGQLLFTNGVPSEWVPITSLNAPDARSGHAAVWFGDKMFVWGGKNGGVVFGDGAAFCAHCDTWFPIAATNAPSPRFDHAMVPTTTGFAVFGGSNNGGELANGATYDPVVGEWLPVSTLGAPTARTGGGGVWTGTELVLFGGRSGGAALASPQRLVPQPTWYFYRKL